jgi:hypothetical protein
MERVVLEAVVGYQGWPGVMAAEVPETEIPDASGLVSWQAVALVEVQE